MNYKDILLKKSSEISKDKDFLFTVSKLVKTDNEAKLILDYIEQNKDEQFESILSLILEICNKRKQSKNTLKSKKTINNKHKAPLWGVFIIQK